MMAVAPLDARTYKPVISDEIEAVCFDGSYEGAASINEWIGKGGSVSGFIGGIGLCLQTPTGFLTVSSGEYIVRYENGVLSKFTPDSFQALFHAV